MSMHSVPPTSAPALLEARDVVQELGRGELRQRILHGVSLRVRKGELVALTGTSGSGKSTFLYILGALDRPVSGKVFYRGHDLTAMRDDDRARFRGQNLGYIFQFHFLLSELSVEENVALPSRRHGLSPKQALANAHAALRTLGLERFARRMPTQLSGGQQQRVAIARAIAHRPALILADEPTGSLDSHNAAAVFAALQHLARANATAIVMVTHDPTLAAACDRWVTLADGRVIEDRVRQAGAPAQPMRPAAFANLQRSAENLAQYIGSAERADDETIVLRPKIEDDDLAETRLWTGRRP